MGFEPAAWAAIAVRPPARQRVERTMQLTRFTDYSLRTLMYLGLNHERLVTIAEIAEMYRVSENHLMKIVHRLGQHGYIETIRGKGGGMRLARPADRIRIGELVRDTEENMDLAECFNPRNRDCPMLPECALQAALFTARESFLERLNGYTVADLIANKQSAGEVVVRFPASRKKAAAKRS
jgi:Rrf2 family nitric oxide-sensitive transcriptional repressor